MEIYLFEGELLLKIKIQVIDSQIGMMKKLLHKKAFQLFRLFWEIKLLMKNKIILSMKTYLLMYIFLYG